MEEDKKEALEPKSFQKTKQTLDKIKSKIKKDDESLKIDENYEKVLIVESKN